MTDTLPARQAAARSWFESLRVQGACDADAVADYAKFRKCCDEYFVLPHRYEPCGIGGIFHDLVNSGDSATDFAFRTDDVILLVRESVAAGPARRHFRILR